MAKKKPAKRTALLELPCAFSNVNIGDHSASVGVTVSRANLTVNQADKHICGCRLSGSILARSNGAQADQDSLPGLDEDTTIDGVFDVGAFSAKPKTIGFGLKFSLRSIDVTELARFAKREGRVTIWGTEAIPEGEANGDE